MVKDQAVQGCAGRGYCVKLANNSSGRLLQYLLEETPV